MAFNLRVSANTPPVGSCYPSTWAQALQNIASNLIINGLGALTSFSFGPNTPPTDAQSSPWFKTDSQFSPLNWYAFSGGQWVPIPAPFYPGHMMDFYGSAATIVPPWYICNGQAITGPVNGALTTPNFQGLVSIGTGTNPTSGLAYANQSTGGGSVIQTASMIPAHPHLLLGNNSTATNTIPVAGEATPTTGLPGLAGFITGGNSTGVDVNGNPNPPLPTPTIPPYLAVYKTIYWP